MTKRDSIFKQYYSKVEFIDRKVVKNEEGIDVIVPIINTNELFEANLYSWYRQIPINRLLIGYGGGTDDSLEILKKFPRVVIVNQDKKYLDHLYGSQGICIAELISLVETEWFIYLHSDVYLPEDWYDIMIQYQDKYDWYECSREITALISFKHDIRKAKRAYSGSQMGRKKAFENILPKIEDGYVQNNEDIIFSELIIDEGYKYGRVFTTNHYHQLMNKGDKEPKYEKISIAKEKKLEWKKKINLVMVRGIIKYLEPKQYLIDIVNAGIIRLIDINALNTKQFKIWVKNTNKIWLEHIKLREPFLIKIFKILLRIKKFENYINKSRSLSIKNLREIK